MRILVVSAGIPFPPFGGGLLRTYHLVRALAARHEVTLVGFAYDQPSDPTPIPIRVIAVPWQWPPLYQKLYEGDDGESQRAYKQLNDETDEPWFVSFYQSSAMEEQLRALVLESYDLVLFEGTDMGRFLPLLPPETPKILDFMDLNTLMAQRAFEGKTGEEARRARHEAERTINFERKVARDCVLCLACSEPEASAARRLLGISSVEVVPNGVDIAFFCPVEEEPEETALLFTGLMSYEPNAEAVRYFAAEILPFIRQKVPGARFHVVGTNPPQQVRELVSESVLVHGRVPDVRPYFRHAAVVVVPLQRGGGTRLKILEAAACGKAIVTTSRGVEGLDFRPGMDLVVADSPAEFASAVTDLIADPARRRRLGQQARRISLRYDWERIGSMLCRIVEEKLDGTLGVA